MKFTLVHLLFLCLNLAAYTTGDDQFVYSGFSGANLTFDGAATVTPGGLLQLTNGTDQQTGHAFYPTPLNFTRSRGGEVQSFSASFVFAILSIYTDLSAHGMALVVASSKNFSSALPGQLLGLTDIKNNGNGSNHFFAVELDTIQNKEYNDLNANHAGANVNGLTSLQSYYAGYFDDKDGNFRNLSLISRQAMQVWVDYDHKVAQIAVTMAPIKVGRPVKPLFTATYNLTAVVTDVAYVGFSSATGTINVRHYVLGWSFAMNGPAPAIDIAKLPKLPHVGPKPRSKRPVNNASLQESQVLLVERVLEQWSKESLLDTVDKRLEGNYDAAEACVALKLGLLCSHPFANARPSMREVVHYLEGDMPLPEMTPTDLSFQMMAIMQNGGFDQFIMAYPSSSASIESMSLISDGR
ncbi:hypothetical protein ACQ4PT_037164 [Festuca glaucescens]